MILLYHSSGTGVINLVLLCNVEIESHHWIVYLCSAWAQGGFSWLTENWKIIFLSRERHWRPLTNRIPQEKSCRKDFTPNNSVIADGNRISLLSFTSLYNHVYQNTLNFVQSCKVQYDLVTVMILMIPWFSKPVKVIDKIWMKKKYVEPIDENAMLAYLRVPKH